MRNTRFMRHMRAKCEEIWALPKVKLAFVIVATAIGTGAYYQPIVKALFFTKPDYTEEQLSFFDKDNFYPIKVRKQRELEKKQTFPNSQGSESS